MIISSLSEVAYLRRKRPLLLLEILELLEGLKPGVYIEDYNNELISKLASLSKSLKLYLSTKNGGYITNKRSLLTGWESSTDPIRLDAHKFIGYPACCVNAFSKLLKPLAREVYWYYLLRTKPLIDLVNYAYITSFVDHYPCSFECAETKSLSLRVQEVINKYADILPKNIKKRLLARRLSSIRRLCRSISKAYISGLFKDLELTYQYFKDQGLIKTLSLDDGVKEVISDLFSPNSDVVKFIRVKLKALRNSY